MRFKGKHVVITGAARGIGYEIANQFGKEGATLSLLDSHPENLAKTFDEFRSLGFEVYQYAADVSVRSDVKAVIGKAESVKPIDVLINNAGVAEEIPFLKITEEQWRRVLDINLPHSWSSQNIRPWDPA